MKCPLLFLSVPLCCLLLATGAVADEPVQDEVFTVLVSGTVIGQMVVSSSERAHRIDCEFRNNGRGPTLVERIELDADGFSVAWRIEGHTTLTFSWCRETPRPI